MKLNTIHHVAIIVSDYERAKEFYVGKLGFQVLRENYQSRRGSYKLDLKAGLAAALLFPILLVVGVLCFKRQKAPLDS